MIQYFAVGYNNCVEVSGLVQWIYVVYYCDFRVLPAQFEVLRAFKTEKRAQALVDLLTRTPFERHSLATGQYLYRKVALA